MFARFLGRCFRWVFSRDGAAFAAIVLVVGGLYFYPERLLDLVKMAVSYALQALCWLLTIAGNSLTCTLADPRAQNIIGQLFVIGVTGFLLWLMAKKMFGKGKK